MSVRAGLVRHGHTECLTRDASHGMPPRYSHLPAFTLAEPSTWGAVQA